MALTTAEQTAIMQEMSALLSQMLDRLEARQAEREQVAREQEMLGTWLSRECTLGTSQRAVARHLGVPSVYVYRWVHRLRAIPRPYHQAILEFLQAKEAERVDRD